MNLSWTRAEAAFCFRNFEFFFSEKTFSHHLNNYSGTFPRNDVTSFSFISGRRRTLRWLGGVDGLGINPLLVSQKRYDQRLPVAQFNPAFSKLKLPQEILCTSAEIIFPFNRIHIRMGPKIIQVFVKGLQGETTTINIEEVHLLA